MPGRFFTGARKVAPMKKLLKWLLVAVGVVALVVFGGGMLMPSQVSVSRDLVINASPEKIFPHVANLKSFNVWSPWADIDPKMKVRFSGTDDGVGQVMSWDSNDMGKGSMKIVEFVANEKLVTALDFGQKGTASAQFDLVPDTGGTKVTWSITSELGNNPIARWFGPMIKSDVSETYDKGLAKLRVVAEGE